MDMSITVEGIEQPEQADLLQQLGCQEGQGYFFARPLPFAALSQLLGEGLNHHPAAGPGY
jgi:EAL domain-containing protein (putative c-di-GMP-specific phosphodiesterase class I)